MLQCSEPTPFQKPPEATKGHLNKGFGVLEPWSDGRMNDEGPGPRPQLVDSSFTKTLPELYRFIFSFGKVGAFKLVCAIFANVYNVPGLHFGPFSDRFLIAWSKRLPAITFDYLRLPKFRGHPQGESERC